MVIIIRLCLTTWFSQGFSEGILSDGVETFVKKTPVVQCCVYLKIKGVKNCHNLEEKKPSSPLMLDTQMANTA